MNACSAVAVIHELAEDIAMLAFLGTIFALILVPLWRIWR